MPPFPVLDVDRAFYAEHLGDWMPEQIIDIHTHVWRQPASGEGPRRTVAWPARVAPTGPVEELLESYRLMLPGKRVTPVIFANPTGASAIDAQNEYVRQSAARFGLPGFILAHPSWPGEELERRVLAGGFVGVKVYLTFAPPELDAGQITIFDFLPPYQLEVLDRRGWPVILHLPRPGRLRDPVNLRQLLQIERDFPNARVVVAHVGRAYCDEDVGDAFDVLAPARRMCFDISANTNERVFARLIRAVGAGRILFGSDMPITRMRMRRVCENGRYVNIVPRGLYGDVSGDPNMRETDGQDAARLTFFLYEELAAFRRAADAAGLTRADISAVFAGNARSMLPRP